MVMLRSAFCAETERRRPAQACLQSQYHFPNLRRKLPQGDHAGARDGRSGKANASVVGRKVGRNSCSTLKNLPAPSRDRPLRRARRAFRLGGGNIAATAAGNKLSAQQSINLFSSLGNKFLAQAREWLQTGSQFVRVPGACKGHPYSGARRGTDTKLKVTGSEGKVALGL